MRAGRNTRQLLLMTVILMAGASPTLAQVVTHKSAEQAVGDAFKAISSGYTGSTEKDLEPLGDAAAIELIRLFAGRDLAPEEIRSSLLIIRMSFSTPKLITIETDRHPRATLLLLRYLDYQVKEPELRQSIAETTRSLKAQLQ